MGKSLGQYALELKQGKLKPNQIPPAMLQKVMKVAADMNPDDFNPLHQPKQGNPPPRSAIRKVRRA